MHKRLMGGIRLPQTKLPSNLATEKPQTYARLFGTPLLRTDQERRAPSGNMEIVGRGNQRASSDSHTLSFSRQSEGTSFGRTRQGISFNIAFPENV